MWGHDPERGHIRDIVFRDVTVVGGPFPASELSGHDDAHAIEGVTFHRLRIHGQLITEPAAAKLATRHARNVRLIGQ